MKNTDRLFIDKFDNFIFTVRKILYYGDTSASLQPKDPKHDRLRFINYFSDETDYYDAGENLIDFSDDTDLKDIFADLYTYRAMSTSEMGDALQLFSNLSEGDYKTVNQLIAESARNPKNFNRRIEAKTELAESGAILIQKSKPKRYKKNVSLCKGLTQWERRDFINALNFAIKKTNFSAFASTYKKLLAYSYSIEGEDDSISIDHQLFHPVLDEFHLWSAISAMTEGRKIAVDYCSRNFDFKETVKIENAAPLKIVYDNLYGRSYIFVYDSVGDTIFPIRLDRILHMEQGDIFDAVAVKKKKRELEKRLKTSWLVGINESTEKVILRFSNLPFIRNRVENEGRHGAIANEEEAFFTYEIEVNDALELTNWILSFGEHCKVVAPNHLAETIIKHLEGIINEF